MGMEQSEAISTRNFSSNLRLLREPQLLVEYTGSTKESSFSVL